MTGRFGARKLKLGTLAIGPKRFATLTKVVRIAEPAALAARPPVPLRRLAARHVQGPRKLPAPSRGKVGVRGVRVGADGRLLVNGRAVNVRGVGLQEDSRDRGFAIDNRAREQQLAWMRELGAGADPRPLPAAPLHARARRRARAAASGRRSPSTRSTPRSSPSSRFATPRSRCSRATSSPTATTRRSCCGRSATSSARGPGRCRPRTSRAPRARRRRSTPRVRSRWPSRPRRPSAARRSTGRSTCIGVNDYFGWYPGHQRRDRRPRAAQRVPRHAARLLPDEGADDQRVRRRGQPRRARRGARHLRLPARLRRLPPRRLRDQAVALGVDLLGAAGVPRAARAGTAATRARSRRSTRRASSASTARASRRSPTCSRPSRGTTQFGVAALAPLTRRCDAAPR